ncbi:PEP-CTERM sorting domain-containing protein [bacterium]|nr:PEP-CTERM sorting domain-containing protein [bacterium]
MRTAKVVLVIVLFVSVSPAHALLQQFSVADGYQDPFYTRVWTYNSLWHLDGGALGNNYVAQHGYGAGFAFSEPYALVVRNDNPAGNYLFSYDFESADLGGVNPAALTNEIVQIQFDACSTVAQNTTNAVGDPMLTMAFGGTRANPGLTLGFSDGNHLMWSDAAGVLQEYGAYTLNSGGWDRITLAMDFANDTYDVSVSSMTGPSSVSSNLFAVTTTYAVATAVPFTNPLGSMQNLYWETFTQGDADNQLGWHKAFFDNFGSPVNSRVPEPATATLALMGIGMLVRRRRRNKS